MKSALKLTAMYKGIPEYWIRFLRTKFDKVEGTPVQRERRLEEFLDGVAEMLKDPYVVDVGSCKFSKIMRVVEVKLPIGYRVNSHGGKYDAYGNPIYKEYRFGFTSDGTIIGSHSDEGVSLNWSYLDKQFYVSKDENDKMVFWHQTFMDKVKNLMGEAHTSFDGVLESENRMAGDEPSVILSEQWLRSLKLQLSIHCNMKIIKDEEKSSLAEILLSSNESIGSIVGDDIILSKNRHSRYDTHPVDILVDRYVDWALVKGIPLESIVHYTLGNLYKEFWVEVEDKANKLRDEFLERYGFERYNSPEAVAKLALPSGRVRFNYEMRRSFEQVWNKAGWFKAHHGNIVFISGDGSVYINDRRICIIGEKNNAFLPNGDKIVQMVVAVGTKFRENIYTLEVYRPMLEEMFQGDKDEGFCEVDCPDESGYPCVKIEECRRKAEMDNGR